MLYTLTIVHGGETRHLTFDCCQTAEAARIRAVINGATATKLTSLL